MNFEATKWFQIITGLSGLVATWWLCRLVGLWPFGHRMLAAVVVFGLCSFGAQRLVHTLLGMALLAAEPRRREQRTARIARYLVQRDLERSRS